MSSCAINVRFAYIVIKPSLSVLNAIPLGVPGGIHICCASRSGCALVVLKDSGGSSNTSGLFVLGFVAKSGSIGNWFQVLRNHFLFTWKGAANKAVYEGRFQ